MADIGASRRGTSYGRRLCVAWLALSVASCADLLDLPSDPRLEEAATAPPEAEPARPVRGEPSPGPAPLTSVGSADPSEEPPAMPSPTVDPEGSDPEGSDPEGSDPEGSEPAAGASGGEALQGGGSDEAPPAAAVDAGAPPPPEPEQPQEPPSGCVAPEIVGPNGRCFLVVEEPLAWEDARANCRARGDDWDLAAIRDAAVNDFVGTLTDAEAWIGGSDAASEATWRWVNEGDAFWSGDGTTGEAVNGAFEAWNSNEPNGRGNSDCARTVPIVRTGEGLTWADLECFELRASLCEGPPLESR